MIESPDTNHSEEDCQPPKGLAAMEDVRAWFIREVLPLEPALIRYLHRNWRCKDDILDIRNDTYVKVYEAALKKIPDKTRQFVVTIARNLLIDRFRHEHIVPIEAVADLDALGAVFDLNPERTVTARDELRRLQHALERIPRRTREVIIMRRMEGLSRAEISRRLEISEETVSAHVTDGVRMLTEMLCGEIDDFTEKR